jgi:hypothetical protein
MEPASRARNSSASSRGIAWHFPFWQREGRSTSDDRHDTLSLFAAAPAGLFVFLKKPMGEVQVTEPLLVQWADKGKAGLVALTGAELSVRLEVVSTEVPAELSFPKPPEFKPAKTVDEAMGLAGPDEQKLVAAYLEKERAHNACVGAWMKKNDPTWGKSYELVNVRTGRTLSQSLFKKADAVCGLGKLDKASSAFVVAINAAQKRLRTTIGPELRKKLLKR